MKTIIKYVPQLPMLKSSQLPVLKSQQDLILLQTYFKTVMIPRADSFPYVPAIEPPVSPRDYYKHFVEPRLLNMPSRKTPKRELKWSHLISWLLNTREDLHNQIFKKLMNDPIKIIDDGSPFMVYRPPIVTFWKLPPPGYVVIHFDAAQKEDPRLKKLKKAGNLVKGKCKISGAKNVDGKGREKPNIRFYPIGYIVRDQAGERLLHCMDVLWKKKDKKDLLLAASEFDDDSVIVVCDIIEAELEAIKRSFLQCLANGYVKVILYVERNDVLTALSQDVGLPQPKYQKLLSEIQLLKSRFDDCLIYDIMSHHNSSAHYLAEAALDIYLLKKDEESVLEYLTKTYMSNERGGRCEFLF